MNVPTAFCVGVCIPLLFGGASLQAGVKTMNLITQNKPAPVIVTGTAASPSEKFAAVEMSTYLENTTGQRTEIVNYEKEKMISSYAIKD